MSADGHPVQLATSRLPRSLTEGTPIESKNTGPGGTYARPCDYSRKRSRGRAASGRSPRGARLPEAAGGYAFPRDWYVRAVSSGDRDTQNPA